MRIFYKGGAWRNTEDEILKAAVMKYGKNQWARISSLFNRKSAKQCKARWYEWLDPSIKKTEWTREEEEKLLHLAKLMPMQWRTIAPIVGRTASQCMEHYEKLLDQAQKREEGGADGASSSKDAMADDPRRLRPGEIDPSPETKPARPDAIDMDDDEKEMLSEARARLANTKGKKAKRKAREKQLEEAKRLTSLQKRRELKAAGVETGGHKKKSRFLDYNAEIPFERQAPAGFYDTHEEDEAARKDKGEAKINKLLSAMEGKRRSEEEARAQKEDSKRQRMTKTFDLPKAIMQISKLNDPENVRTRSKLSLPAPQVSDAELEDLAKLGVTPEALAAASATSSAAAASKITNALLGDYRAATPAIGAGSAAGRAGVARTPSQADSIMMEAQNLAALQRSGTTPLRGGSSIQLNAAFSDFGGVTPRRKEFSTPNPLATPRPSTGLHSSSASVSGFSGASGSSTPLRRAVRDELHINDESASSMGDFGLRAEKLRLANSRKALSDSLASLPKPKNRVQLKAPKDMKMDDDEEKKESALEMDASEIRAKKAAEKKRKEEDEFRRRTSAVQRGLPRPLSLSSPFLDYVDYEDDAELPAEVQAAAMIQREMAVLLQRDLVLFPFGSEAAPSSLPSASDYEIESYDHSVIEEARRMIAVEEQALRPAGLSDEVLRQAFEQTWADCNSDLIYVPEKEARVRASDASKQEKLSAVRYEFKVLSESLGRETKRAAKLEQKTQVLTAGLQQRSSKISAEILETFAELEKLTKQANCFARLRDQELGPAGGAQQRVEDMKALVHEQREKESRHQMRYANAVTQNQDLRKVLGMA